MSPAKGRWCYLYRAIDSAGATIDFLLSAFRDADAAKRLFRKALRDVSAFETCNTTIIMGVDTEESMSAIAYTSDVRIERIKGPLRRAYLPGEPQPVMFSVHGGIAKHYGIDESQLPEPHAATIDYVIAALGG